MPYVVQHGGRSQVGLAGAAGRAQGKANAQQQQQGLFLSAFNRGVELGANAVEQQQQREQQDKLQSEQYRHQVELTNLNNAANQLEQENRQDFQHQENELYRSDRKNLEEIQQRGQDRREGLRTLGKAATAAGETIRGLGETVRKGVNEYGRRVIAQQEADVAKQRAETDSAREARLAAEATAKAEAEAKKRADSDRISNSLKQSLFLRFGVDNVESMPLAGQAAYAQAESEGKISPTLMKMLDDEAVGIRPSNHETATEREWREFAKAVPEKVAEIASTSVNPQGLPSDDARRALVSLRNALYDDSMSYQQLVDNRAKLTKASPEIQQMYDARIMELRQERQRTILPKAADEIASTISKDFGGEKLALVFSPGSFASVRRNVLKKYRISPEEYAEYSRELDAKAQQMLMQQQQTNKGAPDDGNRAR